MMERPLTIVAGLLLLPSAALALNSAVDVAIIGGGPCGLATAIALAKAPYLQGRVAVFEKDQYRPKGASIQISGAGWSALKAIDGTATSRVRATSTPVSSLRFRTFAGIDLTQPPRLLVRLLGVVFATLRLFGVRRGLSRTHLWHDVRTVLRERTCELLGDSALRAGHELQSLSEEADAIALRFIVNGDEEMKVQARLVIACDGARSTVRALTSEPADLLLDEGKSVWRGTSPSVDPRGCATFYRGENGESALIFPAGLEHGASWSVIAPVLAGRSTTQEQARERLSGALPEDTETALLDVIAKSESIIEHKLVTRNFDKPWTSAVSRIAYLGDASHPLRPTGEGTALAFEDAWALGDLACRSESLATFLQPATLRTFEESRRERVRAVSDAVKASANRFYSRKSEQAPEAGPMSVAEAQKAYPTECRPLLCPGE